MTCHSAEPLFGGISIYSISMLLFMNIIAWGPQVTPLHTNTMSIIEINLNRWFLALISNDPITIRHIGKMLTLAKKLLKF